MKKFIFLAAAIVTFGCSKKNEAINASFSFNLQTENTPPQLYNGTSSGSCTVSSPSGSYSGHRYWQFIFSANGNQKVVNIFFPGDFTNDSPPLDSLLSFKYGHGEIQKFWCTLAEGSNLTRIGSDSAYLQVSFSKFQGGRVGGSFSFRVYDPGLNTIISDGKFSGIPVVIK